AAPGDPQPAGPGRAAGPSGAPGPLPERRPAGEVGDVLVQGVVGVLMEAPLGLDAGLARGDVVGDPQAVAGVGGGVHVEPEVAVAVEDHPAAGAERRHLADAGVLLRSAGPGPV